MNSFIDIFAENVKMFPDKVALISDDEGSLTYRQLDEQSGRIYGYLKGEGIGREDVVYIHMTRGLGAIISIIGVIKAGACFTVSEENAPFKMCEYIAEDCNAKLIIDDDLFSLIIKQDFLYGYEKTAEHDAAYIVYTSGTTDKPKGVLHEYGNLIQAVESHFYEGQSLFGPDDVFAVLAPLNFVAAIMDIIVLLYHGGAIFLVARDITRNPEEVMNRCKAHNVTSLFMVPSLVKLLQSVPESIRFFIVGGEPTDGDFRIKTDVYNFLAMSETGFGICVRKCDGSDADKLIGRPQFNLDIILIGRDGNMVQQGRAGELCFENPYVRGYLNLPDENARSFKNGLFHTGDEAALMENGEYRLCGRLDSMLKINGNRVDPTEVEIICRKVLNVTDLAVKGFVSNNRSFLCLYYVADFELDISTCRDELLEYLPYYMIPSYFVRLDSFPLNSNAKKDRKALQMPCADLYKNDFCSPRNMIEEKLCTAFEKALGIDKIGIFDDFLLLGGDSVAAYKIVLLCNIPGIKVCDIFAGHTPDKIANIIGQRPYMTDANLISLNFNALFDEHMLMQKQREILDIQLKTPTSSMWMLSSLDRLKEDVDVYRFKEAVDMTLSHHPVFSTKFVRNNKGDIVQIYDPDVLRKTDLIEISEEEFRAKKESLLEPVSDYFDSPLYYTAIYKTEVATYFHWAVHHVIFDGTSLKLFRNDIFEYYKDINSSCRPDYYYWMLSGNGDGTDNCDNNIWPYTPLQPYRITDGKEAGEYDFLPYYSTDDAKCSPCVNEYGVNTSLTAAIALALYYNSHNSKIKFKWVYNGRDDVYKLNVIGPLFKTLSVAVDVYEESSLDDFLRHVKCCLNDSILRGMRNTCDIEGNEYALCLIFQDDIYDWGSYRELIDSSDKIACNNDGAYTPFDVEVYIARDQFKVGVHYNRSVFEDDSVRTFCDLFVKFMHGIMNKETDTQQPLNILLEKIKKTDGSTHNE